MADSVTVDAAENATLNETAANATAKVPATIEGMSIAYLSLFIMAIFPIFIGSFRSVKHHQDQKNSGEKPETMTSKDAAMFPLIASGTLLGIYVVFKIFSKEYINLLLAFYFFFLGVLALAHIAGPIIQKFLPASFPNLDYHLIFTQGKGECKEELMNYEFDRKDLVSLAVSLVVGIWYLWKKHWIANNLFGLAFAVNGVELLSLNRISTGCILLGGLFVYDIFWVFGTDVMVTVAKSFEAPIKFWGSMNPRPEGLQFLSSHWGYGLCEMVFPQDLLEKGLAANNFAMLGLGDIVIPGIFIALLLRYDISLKNNKKTYFYSGFVAYCLGLLTTIVVMHVFKHAQPALLYLVPACVGLPVLVALVKGDVKSMFSYEDHSEEKPPACASDKDAKKEK